MRILLVCGTLAVPAWALCVAQSPRPCFWEVRREPPPREPTLSCYLIANGSWACAEDAELLRDVSSDDSY